MTTHPYWAYKADPGALSTESEREALDEGRRAFALELAVTAGRPVDHLIVERARVFEAYLKGDDLARPTVTRPDGVVTYTSAELLALEKNSGVALFHNGTPAVYRPRYKGDREPWLCEGDDEFSVRYPASAIQAVAVERSDWEANVGPADRGAL